LGLARSIMTWLPSLVPASVIPLRFEFVLNARVWSYSLVLTVLTALGFGIVPAWRADILAALCRDRMVDLFHLRIPLRTALVVGQIAVAQILLFLAGVALHTLASTEHLDPGFDTKRQVVLATLIGYGDDGAPRTLDASQMITKLSQIPGVRAIAHGRTLPVSGSMGPAFQLGLPNQEGRQVFGGQAGPGFLPLLGVRLRQGRDLMSTDRRGVLANRVLARMLSSDEDVVGRTVMLDNNRFEVVGLLEDVRWSNLRDPERPRFLTLMPDRVAAEVTFAISVAGSPERLLPAVRAAITSASPDANLLMLTTVARHYEDAVLVERTLTQLLYGLGLLALAPTAAGLQAIAASVYARRTREFGIRLALGARPAQIVGLLTRHSLLVGLLGCLLGIALALPIALVAASRVSGLRPWNPWSFILSTTVVLLAALLAAAPSIRRALRLQPAEPLRAE